MSCNTYIENPWRKDICKNCGYNKSEHSLLEHEDSSQSDNDDDYSSNHYHINKNERKYSDSDQVMNGGHQVNEWIEYKTDYDVPYYFNTITQETVWEKPLALKKKDNQLLNTTNNNNDTMQRMRSPTDIIVDNARNHEIVDNNDNNNDLLSPEYRRLSAIVHRLSAHSSSIASKKHNAHGVSMDIPSIQLNKLDNNEEPQRNGAWIRYSTDEGLYYYYNTITQKTQWTQPDSWKNDDDNNNNNNNMMINDTLYEEEYDDEDGEGLFVNPLGAMHSRNISDKSDIESVISTQSRLNDIAFGGEGIRKNDLEAIEMMDLQKKIEKSSSATNDLAFWPVKEDEDDDLSDFLDDKGKVKRKKESCISRWRAFWRDQWYGGRPAEDKCKCCLKHRQCHRFWADRRTRWVMIGVGTLIFGYLLYLIWVIVQFNKMANSTFLIQKLEIPDLCTYKPSFSLVAQIDNPSKLGLTFHHISMHLSRPDRNPMAHLEFEPNFEKTGNYFSSGLNILSIDTHASILDINTLSEVFSLVLSDSKKIPIQWDYSFKITTTSLGFPLTTTVKGDMITFMNDDDPSKNSFADTPENIPPPEMTSAFLMPTNNKTTITGDTLGIGIQTNWTLYPSGKGIKINVPKVGLRGHSDNVALAEVLIEPFWFIWGGPATFDILISYFNDNDPGMLKLQDIVSNTQNNITYFLGIDGDTTMSNILGTTGCLAQDIVNIMPRASLEIIPKPYNASLCPECTTAERIALQNNETSEVIDIDSVELRGLERSLDIRNTFIDLIPRVKFLFSFILSGHIPDIWIDIVSKDVTLGYVKVSSFVLTDEQDDFTALDVKVAMTDETTLINRFQTESTMSDWELWITGRTGENMLSSIIAGFSGNLTQEDDPTTTNNNNSPQNNLSNKNMSLKFEHNATYIQAVMNGTLPVASVEFDIIVPKASIVFNYKTPVNTSGNITFEQYGILGQLDIDEIFWDDEGVSPPVRIKLAATDQHGRNIRTIIEDILANKLIGLQIALAPTTISNMTVDFSTQFTKDSAMDVLDNNNNVQSNNNDNWLQSDMATESTLDGYDVMFLHINPITLNNLRRDVINGWHSIDLTLPFTYDLDWLSVEGEIPGIQFVAIYENIKVVHLNFNPVSFIPSIAASQFAVTVGTYQEKKLLDLAEETSGVIEIEISDTVNNGYLNNVLNGLSFNYSMNSTETNNDNSAAIINYPKYNLTFFHNETNFWTEFQADLTIDDIPVGIVLPAIDLYIYQSFLTDSSLIHIQANRLEWTKSKQTILNARISMTIPEGVNTVDSIEVLLKDENLLLTAATHPFVMGNWDYLTANLSVLIKPKNMSDILFCVPQSTYTCAKESTTNNENNNQPNNNFGPISLHKAELLEWFRDPISKYHGINVSLDTSFNVDQLNVEGSLPKLSIAAFSDDEQVLVLYIKPIQFTKWFYGIPARRPVTVEIQAGTFREGAFTKALGGILGKTRTVRGAVSGIKGDGFFGNVLSNFHWNKTFLAESNTNNNNNNNDNSIAPLDLLMYNNETTWNLILSGNYTFEELPFNISIPQIDVIFLKYDHLKVQSVLGILHVNQIYWPSGYNSFADISGFVQVNVQQGQNLMELLNSLTAEISVSVELKNTAVSQLNVNIGYQFEYIETTNNNLRRRLLSIDKTALDLPQAEFGLVELRQVELFRWHRKFTEWHGVWFNMTMNIFGGDFVDVNGNFPEMHFPVFVRTKSSSTLFEIDILPINIPKYSTNGLNLFYVNPKGYTSNEVELTEVINDISNGIETTFTVEATSTDLFWKKVLSHLKANVSMNELPFNETETEIIDEVESTTDWHPFKLDATSTPTTLNLAADWRMPLLSLPFNLSLGQLSLAVDHVADPLPKHTLLNINADPIKFCQKGCVTHIRGALSSNQPDNGAKLSVFVNKLLNNLEDLQLQIHGTAGRATIDLWVYAVTPEDRGLVDTVAGSLSNNLFGNNATEEEHEKNREKGFAVNRVHILGSGTNGVTGKIPCILPGDFCPIDANLLTGTSLQVMLNISLADLPLPMPIHLTTPDLDFDFDCCSHSSLFKLNIAGFTFHSDEPYSLITIKTTPSSLSLLQYAVKEIQAAEYDFIFRVHGTVNSNLISSMFQEYESLITLKQDTNQQQGGSTECTGSTCPYVNYWLAGTSANSMSLLIDFGFDNSATVPINFGDVSFIAAYDGYDVARIDMNINYDFGWVSDQVIFLLHGEPVLTSRCSGSALPTASKRFCVASEALAALIAYKLTPDGVPIKLRAEFTNYYGVLTKIEVDLMMYATEIDPRYPKPLTELGLLHEFDYSVTSTITNFITSFTSGSFNARLIITLKNIFNITIQASYLQMDMLVRDFDGVGDYWYIPGTPMSPDNDFLLINDAKNTLTNYIITPGNTRQTTFDVPISYSSAGDAMRRLYDDYYVKNRLCVHLREGVARFTIKYGSNTALTYDQTFHIDDMSVVSMDDCAYPYGCDAARQTIVSYTSFGSTDWNKNEKNGGSIAFGSTLRLTTGSAWTDISAVWTKSTYIITQSWDVTFSFKMDEYQSCVSTWLGTVCSPAYPYGDGIAFVIQAHSSNPRGSACTTGICHGYKGITRSVGVVIDNLLLNEVAVGFNGNTDSLAARTETLPSYDNNNWWSVRISYLSQSRTLVIYLNNEIVLTVFCDMKSSTFNWLTGGKAYLGFTASTGDAAVATQYIDNFYFKQIQTYITQCFLTEEGQIRGRANVEFFFRIDARDSCGSPRREGGDLWQLYLRIGTTNYVFVSYSSGKIIDNGDGLYTVYATVPVSGTFNIYACVLSNGKGSWSSYRQIGEIKIQ